MESGENDRRRFLKNMGFFTTGALTGPLVLQGCGGGGSAEVNSPPASCDPMPPPPSCEPAPPPVYDPPPPPAEGEPLPPAPPIRQAADHIPVLKFNDAHTAHLFSIDLTSETALNSLNDSYGPGTYERVGNVTFDSRYGAQAEDNTSGLRISLATILHSDARLALAEEGQFTIEVESRRIADPWLTTQYLDRYAVPRNDSSNFPASSGLAPFADLRRLWHLVDDDGSFGPVADGPAPESPSGLGTRANNLGIKMNGTSFQAVQIGVHSVAHSAISSVTVAWDSYTRFTVYVDGVPLIFAGRQAVGAHGVDVEGNAYVANDFTPSNSPKRAIELFFGRSSVRIRRITLGAQAPVFETHALFREWASFGDSFTHRGGFANSKTPVNDLWDAGHFFYFVRELAEYGYKPGWAWNNSLGGGGYLKTAIKSLWDNGGNWDLISLMDLAPSFVMMAASHNDAAFIAKGGAPSTPEYKRRLEQAKADFLEHVQVILTGSSPHWPYPTTSVIDTRIGAISVPPSPAAPGWGEGSVQAQRDLNQFVVNEMPEWVRVNLGEEYVARVATYDAASLFGSTNMTINNPLFEQSGSGVHPNWWGGSLLNFGWWQCALTLMANEVC